MDHINRHCLIDALCILCSFLGSFRFLTVRECRVQSSHVPRCSHEKMWPSNYWRITIIYVWKRNLPLAFVPQHEMNPVQLSHFVSLHDCSLALSTPVASAPRLGPPSGSHHRISSPGNSSGSQSLGSAGSTPNDVIRLLELLLQGSNLSSYVHRPSHIQLSLFCGIKRQRRYEAPV